MIDSYFRQFDALIAAAGIVHSSSITHDKRSTFVGFTRGSVYFLDGSVLHIREFVTVQHGAERYMYAYHYQRPDGNIAFRYDNTPHFPTLSTFPHHKHEGDETNVVAADPPELEQVLTEIRNLIAASS